jgi:hypothetical protein
MVVIVVFNVLMSVFEIMIAILFYLNLYKKVINTLGDKRH